MDGRCDSMEKRPILIVDDDQDFCEMVSATLTSMGFDVLAARDGLKGIEAARAAQPCVILLDMIMPDMDGIITCERLKLDPVLGNIPVVGITGSLDLTYVEKAYSAGAQFFLPKPFGEEALAHVLRLAAGATRSDTLCDDPRFVVEIPVRCRFRGEANTTQELVGRTGNVSLGGLLLVLLSETLARGTVLSLALELPDGPTIADGVVIWQEAEPAAGGKTAHGIRLLRFAEDDDLMQYRRFLSQLAAGDVTRTKP